MRAVNSKAKKSTKDLILEAAFSFYKKPHFDQFSMNELAAKVGITKPAIYRHFKNRDDVVAAMKVHFFDLLGGRLVEISKAGQPGFNQESTGLFSDLISFFTENPQYINYAVSQFSSNKKFEQEMRDELIARGVTSEKMEGLTFGKNGEKVDVKKYALGIFCGSTFLFFIKAREMVIKHVGGKSDSKEFGSKLIPFVVNGLEGATKKDSVIHPAEIDAKRMAELDKICALNPKDFPEEDKILKALAAVVEEAGLNGVTVERIADKLNMAKSSLYFYFENKNQMLGSIVDKELELLMTISIENSADARNYSENLYITMLTELNFFMMRPSLLPICGWLLQSTTSESMKNVEECDSSNVWEKKIEQAAKEVDMGFPMYAKVLTYWSGILPVALTVLRKKHGFTDEQSAEALKYIFNFVQNGIGREIV